MIFSLNLPFQYFINRILNKKILVIGAAGQIGTEITHELLKIHGKKNIIASDIKENAKDILGDIHYEKLNVLDKTQIRNLFKKHDIGTIYHFAAILSASGEKDPARTWDINMDGLLNILNAARNNEVNRIFWPSSIAVFGPGTEKDNTRQNPYMDPSTVYGISKLAGELWISYYNQKYNMDIRSIRYPGVISYKTAPGGGTTDYAVDIYFKALKKGYFKCFLNKKTSLPMMYMPDAVRATIEIMNASKEALTVNTSYNIGSFSANPDLLFNAIKKRISDFTIEYQPDFRDTLAQSWPSSIDDSQARKDWGWKPNFDIEKMTDEMLNNIQIEEKV